MQGYAVDRTQHVPTEDDRQLLELARLAYQAYGDSTGQKNFRGEQMPPFEQLPIGITHAWVAAVQRVRDEVRTPNEVAQPKPELDISKQPADSKMKAALEILHTHGVDDKGTAAAIVDEFGTDAVLSQPLVCIEKWKGNVGDVGSEDLVKDTEAAVARMTELGISENDQTIALEKLGPKTILSHTAKGLANALKEAKKLAK